MPDIPNQDHRFYGSLTTVQIDALAGMSSGDRAYDSTEGLEKVYDGAAWVRTPQSQNVKFTAIGGIAHLLTNKTGSATVKGTIVVTSTAVDDAFDVIAGDGPHSIGVVLEDGIADGSPAWVVTYGPAEVLLKDTTAATRGYWAKVSDDTAGRADVTNASPPGGGIPELDDHMTEIGHCMESKDAGSGVLAKIFLHFN